jgi:hypothetical protein
MDTSLKISYEENEFQKNLNKPWNEWLEFHSSFKNPGKQGMAGILISKTKSKYVFKISQYINYLVEHEYSVLNGLNNISNFCPHFCKGYGILTCQVDSRIRKIGNPFKINKSESGYNIEKNVLLMEYIDNSYKFSKYIKNDNIADENLFNIIKQVLMAISISQIKKKFTHYDLHSDNIMIKNCDKDLAILYVLDENNQFLVPTLGYLPIIIDYGFSFIEDMEDSSTMNNYLWPSLSFTDIGFTSDRFDSIADPKLFLISVSDEIKSIRNSKKSKKFRNIVKNIFHPLSVEWDCGWDNIYEYSASDYVLSLLEEHTGNSIIFKECENYCIDLIQSLIILPLEKRSFNNLIDSFETFINEFFKIESQISNNFFNLYILKGIIDSARTVRSDYYNKDTRESALKKFRHDIYQRIDKVVKYCNTDNIHFEKLLCSLFVLANCIEGVYYHIMENKMERKYKEYDKLPLKTIEQIYGCLDVNFTDNYVYNENTVVMVIDCLNNTNNVYKLTSENIEILNNLHTISRGTYLYNNLTNYNL